jgi:hypothetical protein
MEDRSRKLYEMIFQMCAGYDRKEKLQALSMALSAVLGEDVPEDQQYHDLGEWFGIVARTLAKINREMGEDEPPRGAH